MPWLVSGAGNACQEPRGGECPWTRKAVPIRTLLAGGALPTAVVTSNGRCAVGLLDVFAREGVAVPGAREVVLTPHLVVRSTTAPPPPRQPP